MKKNTLGLIYVFTGDGKGKTSAALGVTVRALAHGWNVDWIALYKEASWNISEFSLPELFLKKYRQRLKMHILGRGFYLPESTEKLQHGEKSLKIASVGSAKVIDDDTPKQHRLAAELALQTAHEVLLRKNPPQVLVLDEICNALDDGLLQWTAVEEMLNQRGQTHIILTGRNASKKLIVMADLVSTIVKEKHPYDSGKLAVKGLDF